jgi:hypothetical protein
LGNRELRVTFRRSFNAELMGVWDELCAVVENLALNYETDSLVWCSNESVVYSTKSLYAIINYRGVKHVYVPAVWKVVVPPKIQLFLWLLSHNKLAKAKNIWSYVSEFLGFEVGTDYVSVASKWLHEDKYYVENTISTAVLRGLWLTRNDFVFNKQEWSDVKLNLRRVLKLLLEWKVIFKESKMVEMTSWLYFLEFQIRGPMKITSS